VMPYITVFIIIIIIIKMNYNVYKIYKYININYDNILG
jgi:hypothetical protein